jgi:hypothetical protein
MENFLPKSFHEALIAITILLSIIFCPVSFATAVRSHAVKISALLFIVGLSLLADHWSTYFAAIFIVSTSVTELDFLLSLASIIRGGKKPTMGTAPPDLAEATPRRKTAMEYKILNTLWTKQVNKWPDLSLLFTFKLAPGSPEFAAFREAGGKLIGEGLISENPDGQYFLTQAGFSYCKVNHKDFPGDQWWPEETINKENLKRVLSS